MKSYSDFLKDELENYEGHFDKYIMNLPALFNLLCRLLEEQIGKEDRREIFSALAYFVIPNDVIPEDIYGPAGYIDDIFVCTVVLKKLAKKYGIDLLKRCWQEDEDIEKVIDVSYEKSFTLLNDKDLINLILKSASIDVV